MLTKLILKNFKVHEDLSVDLTNGIVALKGRNESGKTSLMQAVAYAWFGARVLPMTLADTVTYDKPEASLRVELHFTFENKLYVIVRSKSGAKLTCGDITANGQAEVTKYVESLFGVSADSAAKIIIASQNKLRGALENNEAVPLIEKLANINLIDELISKIQDQLPSGNTSQLVNAISSLDDLGEPVLNREELQPPIDFCLNKEKIAEGEIASLEEAIKGVDSQSAYNVLAEATQNQGLITQISNQLRDLYARKVEPEKPVVMDLDELRKRQALKVTEATRNKVWSEFQKLRQCDTDNSDFRLRSAGNVRRLGECRIDLNDLRVERATLVAKRINDQVCGLCGKDLQDVPEVVAKNIATDSQILAIDASVSKLKAEIVNLDVEEASYGNYVAWETRMLNFYNKYSTYLETDTSVFPMRLKWVGEEGGKPEDFTDYVAIIRQEEQKTAKHIKDLAVYGEVCKSIERLEKQRSGISVDTDVVAKAEFDVKVFNELANKLKTANTELTICKRETTQAKHELALAERQYETELANYAKAQEAKEGFKAQLAEQESNNALIKKLREARPIIATKLWNIVLGSISSHFSQIRGTPSIVTRDATSFLVNGKPAGGVSGSTLDSLGLAIRMALGKTFLPSLNLLLLDEPAAGMDEERETAMLGLLASTSYAQVIVVTHSELADSFATSVVQL